MDISADDFDPTRLDGGSREGSARELVGPEESEGRDSGIVEVERKASAVTGGVTGALASTLTDTTTHPITDVVKVAVDPARREQDIEIDTDLGEPHAPRAQMITQTVVTNGAGSSASMLKAAVFHEGMLNGTVLEEDAIQVSDDEIESAEPARPTLTSGLPAFGSAFSRSRPPAPPSMRPRSSSPSPPLPRRSILGSSLPPPSLPSERAAAERDPWVLANKTLELSRARARISVLEDQIAFRDARIVSLEERLEAAQQKIEELGRKLDAAPIVAAASVAAPSVAAPSVAAPSVAAPSVAGVKSAPVALAPAPAARPSSKPAIAIPKPADVAKAAELARALPAHGDAAKAQAGRDREDELRDSATPEPPEVAGEGISPGEEEPVGNAASALSGPDDVRQLAGIGARFEAALRKQGVTRVSQIAAWSDADVRQVAKALKIPKSRIVKGRWVEAAREMIGSRRTSE